MRQVQLCTHDQISVVEMWSEYIVIVKPNNCLDLFCSGPLSSMATQSQSYQAIYYTFNIIQSEVIVYTRTCEHHQYAIHNQNSTHNAEQIQIRVSWKGMSKFKLIPFTATMMVVQFNYTANTLGAIIKENARETEREQRAETWQERSSNKAV